MDLSADERLDVVLKALDFNLSEINRKEEEQHKLFEWATGLLLASFATIFALSSLSVPAGHPFVLGKIFATIMIVVPICLFIYRISNRSREAIENAKVVEQIEEALHFFDEDYYYHPSLFPKTWQNNLSSVIRKDKMPLFYQLILILMTVFVLIEIWSIL